MPTIQLYAINEPTNKVTKSISVFVQGTFEGTFRTPFDLLNPIVVIQLGGSGFDYLAKFNYARIAEPSDNDHFGNDMLVYYFIMDKRMVTPTLCELTLKRDVLMTYSTQIRGHTLYVERNENSYNDGSLTPDSLMIRDELLPTYEDHSYDAVFTPAPPADSKINITFNPAINDSFNPSGTRTKNVVLSTMVAISSDPSDPSPDYANITAPITGLPNIHPNAFTRSYFTTPYAMSMSVLHNLLCDVSNNFSNYLSFVKSIVAFPFDISSFYMWSNQAIIFGQNTVGDPGGDVYRADVIGTGLLPYLVALDYEFDSSVDFTDLNPYTFYELFMPFYGWIELDPLKVAGCRVLGYYDVNLEDGSATLHVYNATRMMELFSAPCQLGIRLPVNSTNAVELTQQKNANILNMVLGSVSGVLAGVAGLGNPLAVAGGALMAGKSIASGAVGLTQLYKKGYTMNGSSVSGLFQTCTQPLLHIVKVRHGSLTDANFSKRFGRPVHKTKILSSLTGFTICGGDLNLSISGATKPELDEIASLLRAGVIL